MCFIDEINVKLEAGCSSQFYVNCALITCSTYVKYIII